MTRAQKITIENIRVAASAAATLSKRFVKTQQQSDILNKLLLLHEERNCLVSLKALRKIDGLALVAPTGAGKTRTLEWVFAELDRLSVGTGPGGPNPVKIASVRVRTPATLRTAAEAVMDEIGYPTTTRNMTDATLSVLWEKVHYQLKAQKVTVLHFDEAQDIWGNANKPQRKAVINTLKSLSQNKEWPVILVLSGTEELKEMLNQDQQLGRRIKPTELRPISKATDAKVIRTVIKSFTTEVDLEGFIENDSKFIDRFFVACCNRLGIAIDLIIGAIQQAKLTEDPALLDHHFARTFTHLAECDDAMNPFLSEDWHNIDASVLFAQPDEMQDETLVTQKSPRLGKAR
ncbi:TniB family NTP-binding protein [Roseovarius sp. Pro17]|uniref:TniB family NTP-binding protein n=1 Tax=Roseovarius sp. Pro17 TaxID=3108175 RepID=UPI002D782DD0|nr:TniB family NTP-binding protein [Roseovarius sp. Pro17]